MTQNHCCSLNSLFPSCMASDLSLEAAGLSVYLFHCKWECCISVFPLLGQEEAKIPLGLPLFGFNMFFYAAVKLTLVLLLSLLSIFRQQRENIVSSWLLARFTGLQCVTSHTRENIFLTAVVMQIKKIYETRRPLVYITVWFQSLNSACQTDCMDSQTGQLLHS